MKKTLQAVFILTIILVLFFLSSVVLIRTGIFTDLSFMLLHQIAGALSDIGYFIFISVNLLIVGFILFLLFKLDRILLLIKSFIRYLLNAVKAIWSDVKDINAVFILLPPLLSSIYFAFLLPISYDEALTYILFTDNPILYCISSYPFPNNHIFHSIITHITKHLPFFDILFKLRVSSILVSLLTWVIAYSFVKRYYSKKVALFVVAISSMLFMSIYYSYMSRGYALITLFFVISSFAACNIIKLGNRKRDWAIFSICSVLGLYTVPSYLYPFVTLNIIILIFNYKNIRNQFCFNIAITLVTLLCYLPIILHEGFGVLSAPRLSLDSVLTLFPIFFRNTFSEIFGFQPLYVIIVIAIPFIFALIKKRKNILILWFIFGITPVAFLLLHSVIPFPRTFVYYAFVILFLSGVSLKEYINRISIKVLAIILLCMQVGLFINFKNDIVQYEGFNIDFHDVSSRFIEKDKTYYVLSGLNIESHKFEMQLRGYDYDVSKYDRVFLDFDDFKDVDTDTLKGNFDYIIIDKEWDKTINRKPIYENKTLNVYEMKNK